jgi:enamine deaminase RidA (YjgF/YER057c/UK114 family)
MGLPRWPSVSATPCNLPIPEADVHARDYETAPLACLLHPRRPFKEDMKTPHVGTLGADFTKEQGEELAKTVGLELIASLKTAVGDLDKVQRIVKVNGYMACERGFTDLPAVLNGCSNLIGEIFEDRGVQARAAVGVVSLPLGVPIEIDLVAQVKLD